MQPYNGKLLTRYVCHFLTLAFVQQLSFSSGDRLLVLAKPSADWWWAELRDFKGYVPASHLHRAGAEEEEEEDTSPEDPWQDEEYFGSYGTLVRHLKHNIVLHALS